MNWQEWLKTFLQEWKTQIGYDLVPDELSEGHWREDYFKEGVSPSKAVERLLSLKIRRCKWEHLGMAYPVIKSLVR